MRNTKKEDNENQPHFVHEINIKGCDVIGVTVFLSKFMRFLRKTSPLYYFPSIIAHKHISTF